MLRYFLVISVLYLVVFIPKLLRFQGNCRSPRFTLHFSNLIVLARDFNGKVLKQMCTWTLYTLSSLTRCTCILYIYIYHLMARPSRFAGTKCKIEMDKPDHTTQAQQSSMDVAPATRHKGQGEFRTIHKLCQTVSLCNDQL